MTIESAVPEAVLTRWAPLGLAAMNSNLAAS